MSEGSAASYQDAVFYNNKSINHTESFRSKSNGEGYVSANPVSWYDVGNSVASLLS